MTRIVNIVGAGVLLLSLTACNIASRDPWDDPGTWKATGVNDANLQAMVANPNDLVAGQGERTANGVIATTNVNRWLTDKVKPLPIAGAFTVGGGGGGSSGGGQAVAPQ